MTPPILTLAVPTFERPEFLDALLASVEAELRSRPALASAVEVLVSDNASAASTAETVRRWQERLPGTIRYRRNERNVGGPANLVLALEAASGTYAMYVGDDDRMRPGAVELVRTLAEAEGTPPVCLFAHPFFLGAAQAALPADHVARLSVEEAVAGYFFCAGIPGGAAIRTDLVRAAVARAGEGLLRRTNWPQTVLAFLAAAESGEPRPVVVRHTELADVSEHHDENTIYTAWIVWNTWVQGLVVAAEVLAEASGRPLLGPACDDVFAPRRLRVPFEKTIDHLLLVDSAADVSHFAAELEKSIPGLPPAHRAIAQELLAISRTPRGLRLVALVARKLFARPGEVLRRPKLVARRLQSLRRLARYHRRHREKLARYAAGEAGKIRHYAREGY